MAWTLAALLPTLHACYEYVPLATPEPPVGQLVELQITDQGRVNLADRFGPGLDQVMGRVLSDHGQDVVVNVFRVTQLGGTSTQWSGETVRLDRGSIGSIRGREFSKARTTLFAVGAAVVVGVLIANRGLIGSFSGPTDEPPSTEPPTTRTRIPVVSRPLGIHAP